MCQHSLPVQYLLFQVTTLLLLLSHPVLAQETSRPNFLFIAIDDLRPELGCYGVEEIKTPRLDALAQSGMTFNRAYCQLAVCNPSRVSIMTGLRPDSTKVWDLATRFRHTIPNAVTMPQYFKQQGYYTVSFGKIFHNPWPDNQSWSEPHSWPKNSTLWSAKAKQRLAAFKQKMRADGKPDNAVNRIRAQATEVIDVEDHQHIDGGIAEQAISAMQRLAKRDQPFFLAAGFVRPHLPFVVPRKYWDLYDRDEIAMAKNSFLPKDSPTYAMNTMYELRDYLDFYETPAPQKGSLSTEQQARLKHGYYASVSFIDTLVGRLIDELDSLGLTENTVVVVWGDHGWKLGEHNSWCKQSNYEIDARVPLIIRAPGSKANGQLSDSLVELVDVYPTLCELAGLPLPKNLEGNSMVPLLNQTDAPWKDAAFNQFVRRSGKTPLMGYAMRTDRYRYIEWQDRRTQTVVATELYDHQQDPQENQNIAQQNEELISQLSQKMWNTLPKPPKYEAPKARRPEIIFKNNTDQPLTLYWIKSEKEEIKQAIIQPGKQILQNSTLGHQFRITSPKGFNKVFKVDRPRKTININSRKQDS